MLDLGAGMATLSRRQGQCFATLVSGLVFCGKEKLTSKSLPIGEGAFLAAGKRVFKLNLSKA